MNPFDGFDIPRQNYSKLPHDLIFALPEIETVAELKVIIYTLRHTWGYAEYGKPKRITVDEYMFGRKRKDGTRIDNGTGLSENSVRAGLEKAIEHGFLLVEVNDSDKARIEKLYCLNIRGANFEGLTSDFDPPPSKIEPRTEKDTVRKKPNIKPKPIVPTNTPSRTSLFVDALAKHWKINVIKGAKAHMAFLEWAIPKELDAPWITPEMVEYARKTWDNDPQINWHGRRSISMTAFQEEWLKLIDGFGESQEPPQEGFSDIELKMSD